jgi:predicted enzyme related to lactoylglutathione lyase
MPRPVHFEIHADDPARAQRFYETVFDWQFQKVEQADEDYWLITTGPDDQRGINGGLLKRAGGKGDRVIGWVCTMEVDDLDAILAKIQANGGSIAFPKDKLFEMGWLAYAKDPDDNIFGLIQYTAPPQAPS